MKVIYMISTLFYPSIGGVENHIYNLSNELCKKGYSVKVIQPVLNLGSNKTYYIDDIEIHKISIGNEYDERKYLSYKNKSKGNLLGFLYGYMRKWYYNKFDKEILQYIENDIDDNKVEEFIIHQHDFISSIKLSKKLSKKYKVVFTNHTGEFLFLKKIPFNRVIIKMLTNHFSYIMAPSNELAEFDGIRGKNSYEYIPNGVDLELFKPITDDEKLKLRESLNIPKDKVIIFSPRRWAPTKGIIYLVMAAKKILDDNIQDIVFVFGGSDYKDYPEYKKQILEIISSDNKIKANVILEGDIEYSKMHEFMKMADIIVFPSLMEAVSLAALEAMACGKVVLATNVGGFPQIIRDGINGYLINPKDDRQLSNSIKDIIKNIDFILKNS